MSTKIIAIPVEAGRETLVFDTIVQAGSFCFGTKKSTGESAVIQHRNSMQIKKYINNGLPVTVYHDDGENSKKEISGHYFLDYAME